MQKKEETNMCRSLVEERSGGSSQKLQARGRRLGYYLNCSSSSVILASDCCFMKCVVFYVVERVQQKWWSIGARGTMYDVYGVVVCVKMTGAQILFQSLIIAGDLEGER